MKEGRQAARSVIPVGNNWALTHVRNLALLSLIFETENANKQKSKTNTQTRLIQSRKKQKRDALYYYPYFGHYDDERTNC